MIYFGIAFASNVILVVLAKGKEKATARLATAGLLAINILGTFLMVTRG